MGKFDGFLICTDCDGTLTDSNRKISERNAKAIKYFQENGGLFTIASGRYPNYIDEFCADFVPNSYIVACNGAVLYDAKKDEIVISHRIEKGIEDLLCYVFENQPSVFSVSVCSERDEVLHFYRKNYKVPKQWEFIFDGAVPVESEKDIRELCKKIDKPVVKIVFCQDEAHTLSNCSKLNEVFADDFDFIVAWNEGMEALPKGAGKGQMIMEMKKLLPEVHTAIGIGDYGNDISMFRFCDRGYAVSNAPDWVKKEAHYITVSNDEDAVAVILEQIEKDLL
ncbi:MAG: HAD family hydrolase [Clostridia bacterium]|nr:HAD family hydrolase [Clostridia bacterium]